MDEIYGTYVDDDCVDIHAYDDDTDTDTNDDTDGTDDTDDTDDDGRGNLYIIKNQGSRIKAQGPTSRIKDLVRP